MTIEQWGHLNNILNAYKELMNIQEKRMDKLHELISEIAKEQDEINKKTNENIMVLRNALIKLTNPFAKK